MGKFEDIPIREAGDEFDVSWVNTIRVKLIQAFPNIGDILGSINVLNSSKIKFFELESNGDHYTSFQAPDSLTATKEFTLPDGDGNAKESIQTDGSGNLSWGLKLDSTDILDEDDFASDSATKAASQQSIKQYIATQIAAAGGVPTGASYFWPSNTLPSGYLWRNGAAVSRTTYADLFAVIGTTFGSGDGSTTFNVPNDCGRVIAGKDNMGGVTAAGLLTSGGSGVDGETLGATGGSETHTLSEAQLPEHDHPINNVSSSSNAGTNFIRTGDATGGGSTQSTANAGSGQPHNNVQPTAVSNTIIKT